MGHSMHLHAMSLFILAGCFLSTAADVPGMVNPGTPGQVPPSYDCNVRQHAYEFGKATLPDRGSFRTLYDALQLQWCNVTAPTEMDEWIPPTYPTPPSSQALYVSPSGSDDNAGTITQPLQTIAAAVQKAARKPDITILLRAGTYHSGMVVMTTAHNGLTIQNYNGERVVVSGGLPINATKSAWKPYKVAPEVFGEPTMPLPAGWTEEDGSNNVYGSAHNHENSTGIMYLGTFDTLDQCVASMSAANSSAGPFYSLTYHTREFKGKFSRQCFGRTDKVWAPRKEANIDSVKGPNVVPGPPPSPPGPPAPPIPPAPPPAPPNIWMLDLSTLPVGQQLPAILGLRLNKGRAIRAKYPNGNPELSGPDAVAVLTYARGWITESTKWTVPENKWNETIDDVANAYDWPGINWPMQEEATPGQNVTPGVGGTKNSGEGDWGDFHIGHGGFCDDIDPPTGYWCSQRPPRGNCYDPVSRESHGCTQTHMSPDGFTYTDDLLPRAQSYNNPKGAVVNAWRCIRWFTNLCLVDSINKENNTIVFDKEIGCNQGGEGCVRFEDWWIENVFEELDSPNEWFYNETTKQLFFFFNSTTPPTGAEEFVATKTKVLFNITGSQAAPVKDIIIRGLEIRDTALTYLGTDVADKHGMPSGGDWALQRSGAILLEGTERTTIDGNLITRIDGNGISINNYNRNVTVSANEMSWIGDGAIASWGSTGTCLNENCSKTLKWGVGPDARGGNQPWGTHIVGNLVREIGLWQKQSSFYFHATSKYAHIERNVHFNGPRAGLNFNDGMGGGDVIEGNLLANCVRESGDHGPWNSWDRIPYITDDGMIRNKDLGPNGKPPVGPGLPGHDAANGRPSIVPKFREIRKNFIIGTYQSQEDIDTDDGSSYYQVHDNYFSMSSRGLKSDFGGQWHHQWNNVYAYIGQCAGHGNNLAFYNNTCITPNAYGCQFPATMTVENNTLHTPDGKGNGCPTDTVSPYPSDDSVKAMAIATLLPFPIAATATRK